MAHAELLDRELPAQRVLSEETVNTITHGIGLVLSIGGAAALLLAATLHADRWQLAGSLVYVTTLVAVYAASTLSHAARAPGRRRLYRILDQAFIYLLIAGTYTPFALGYLRSGWWWALSAAVWGIAVAGFLSKTLWRHRIDRIAVWAYVGLGWLPLVSIRCVMEQLPAGALWWILLGGLFYTVGVLFLKLGSRVAYFHAVWHLLVIAGSGCHYVAILRYVVC